MKDCYYLKKQSKNIFKDLKSIQNLKRLKKNKFHFELWKRYRILYNIVFEVFYGSKEIAKLAVMMTY